jgi:hypothetical protein
MCRSIKTLHGWEPRATDEEVRAAALQFVRKISGMNKPSKVNEAAFLAAVDEVAGISSRLLGTLHAPRGPRVR